MPTTPAADGALAAFPDHYRGLIRFLTRRTGCADTARDLTHDTWLRLAERRDEGDQGGPAGTQPATAAQDHRAYLYTVAAHLAANLHRHQSIGARWFVEPGHADGPMATVTDDVAKAHALRQAVEAVEKALFDLPARRREIFLTHRLEGTGHAEIAAAHGISVKTVEREVTAAMDAVRAAVLRWRGDPQEDAPVRGRRKALSGLLGLAGLSAGSGAAWCTWLAWQDQAARYALALSTPRGQRLNHTLPDGSQVMLDADSRVEVNFGASHRTLRLLAGSAFFAVTRDPDRPFAVDTPLARITVLGTRFSVELDNADTEQAKARSVAVAVEHGRVHVQGLSAPQAEADLQAGDRWSVEADGAAPRLIRAQAGALVNDVAPWREGWLYFRGTPLATAMRRLTRYSAHPIHVEPAVAGLPVLGRVHIANAMAWLQLLPASLPVRVVFMRDGSVAIAPGPAPSGAR